MALSSEHRALLKRMGERREDMTLTPEDRRAAIHAIQNIGVDWQILTQHVEAIRTGSPWVLEIDEADMLLILDLGLEAVSDHTLITLFFSPQDVILLHEHVYGDPRTDEGVDEVGGPSEYWLAVIDRRAADVEAEEAKLKEDTNRT
jgi:hypothetical protein